MCPFKLFHIRPIDHVCEFLAPVSLYAGFWREKKGALLKTDPTNLLIIPGTKRIG